METLERQVQVDKDLTMDLKLVPTSLSLKEVTVTAKQKESGASTASVVGRQAIDHLQAASILMGYGRSHLQVLLAGAVPFLLLLGTYLDVETVGLHTLLCQLVYHDSRIYTA